MENQNSQEQAQEQNKKEEKKVIQKISAVELSDKALNICGIVALIQGVAFTLFAVGAFGQMFPALANSQKELGYLFAFFTEASKVVAVTYTIIGICALARKTIVLFITILVMPVVIGFLFTDLMQQVIFYLAK